MEVVNISSNLPIEKLQGEVLHASPRSLPSYEGYEDGTTWYKYRHDIQELTIQQFFWLVLTILKNMKVNGKDYPIYDGK